LLSRVIGLSGSFQKDVYKIRKKKKRQETKKKRNLKK